MALVDSISDDVAQEVMNVWNQAHAVWNDQYVDQFEHNRLRPLISAIGKVRERTDEFRRMIDEYNCTHY